MRYELFALSELAPGEVRPALAGSTQIVVVRTMDGEVYALKDLCPHRGPKLSGGTLEAMVVSERRGEYALSPDCYVLRCPWHQFEFDVTSGRCFADPTLRVRSYQVAVVDGTVCVER